MYNNDSYNIQSASARRKSILEDLNSQSFLKVNDLSQKYHVSAITIRKDLDVLEKDGLLRRTHGGAEKLVRPAITSVFADKAKIKTKEKKEIAAALIGIINDGDSVIINVGSTSMYAAQRFHDKKELIVITNSIQVFNEVAYDPKINTFFLGGRFDPVMQFTHGNDTIEQLSRYTADKLIIGMDGVDPVLGATTYNHLESSVMKVMMQQSKERILIVDDSKFGKVAFAHVAPLNAFDIIVTNYVERNEGYYSAIRDMGIKILFS